MIELREVSYRYARTLPPVLEHITLTFQDGETTAVLGAPGSGKTTLLRIIAGQISPSSGGVWVHGYPMKGKEKEKLLQQISFWPTVPAAGGKETVEERIRSSAEKASPENGESLAAYAAEEMKMGNLLTKKMKELSSVERKKVDLACALASSSSCMIFDEPFGLLDPVSERCFCQAALPPGSVKIIASNRLDAIHKMCSSAVVLRQGRILAKGSCRRILENSLLLREAGLELSSRPF